VLEILGSIVQQERKSMKTFSRPQRTALVAAVGLTLGTLAPYGSNAPFLGTQPAFGQTTFTDVEEDYWAEPFITVLSDEGIIKGFPDGSFKPNEPVTRAQFAAIVNNAFEGKSTKRFRPFSDVASSYWAFNAIKQASTTGFLSGYTDGTFKPDQRIPRVQALVSLASGLALEPQGEIDAILEAYDDAGDVPNYARKGVAASTEKRIPVNYPNVQFLEPNSQATRAEIAAFVYQALVSQGQLRPIASSDRAARYIVRGSGTTTPTPTPTANRVLKTGTALPVQLTGATSNAKIFLTPGETVDATFDLASDVTLDQKIVVPKGSRIQGKFEPVIVGNATGARFTAQRLIINDRAYPLNASSPPQTANRQQLSIGDLRGGLATLAAQTLLGSIVGGGGPSIGSLLGGLLRTSGNVRPTPQSNQLIVVDPANLGLKVQSDLAINPQNSVPVAENPPPSNVQQLIAQGTRFDTTNADSSTLVLTPGETVPVELKTNLDYYSSQNLLLVPRNSVIKGKLVPVQITSSTGTTTPGAQFMADTIVINNKSYEIQGRSPQLSSVPLAEVKPAELGAVTPTPKASEALQGRGGFDLGNILINVLGSGATKADRLIIVKPNSLPIQLQAPLQLDTPS
jgi:hypothetical protein